METVKCTTKNGEREFILVDRKTDNCPVCGEPLSSVFFTWNTFHGEASSSCCNAPYQVKDYCIDEDQPQSYKDFVCSLGKPLIWCKVDSKYIKALHQAFSEGLPKDCYNDETYQRMCEIIEG